MGLARIGYNFSMTAANITTYLDYIGAKFRIQELRAFLIGGNSLADIPPSEMEALQSELRNLEERSQGYLDMVLNGYGSSIEQGEDNGNV